MITQMESSNAASRARPLRVLSVGVELPTVTRPGTTAPQARQMQSLKAAGVEMNILEVKGAAKLKYFSALAQLYQRVQDVDLIHAHYGYCGWLARCQLRKPVVVSFMGTDILGAPDKQGHVDRMSRAVVQMNRLFAHSASAIIVKSQEMADIVRPVPSHVVPNGVDLETFRPIDKVEARETLGWKADEHLVLFPGDPTHPRKNLPLAQAAVNEAAALLGEEVRLVPLWRVAPQQVPLYMSACDAMTMTSLKEGSPNVVKEAMACNLPVVGVPVGDVVELISDVEGYFVCPRDAAQLGEKLADILRTKRAVDGRGAIVRKQLDLQSVARKIINIYEEVLK